MSGQESCRYSKLMGDGPPLLPLALQRHILLLLALPPSSQKGFGKGNSSLAAAAAAADQYRWQPSGPRSLSKVSGAARAEDDGEDYAALSLPPV